MAAARFRRLAELTGVVRNPAKVAALSLRRLSCSSRGFFLAVRNPTPFNIQSPVARHFSLHTTLRALEEGVLPLATSAPYAIDFGRNQDSGLNKLETVLRYSDDNTKMQDPIFFARALSFFRQTEVKSEELGPVLLRSIANASFLEPKHKIALFREIWEQLEKRGVEMRVELYNIKLRTWIQNNVEFSAVDFLEEMESKSMQPSKRTCVLLVEKYSSEGDINGAKELLNHLRSFGDVHVENICRLIIGFLTAGDEEAAADMEKLVRGKGFHAGLIADRVLLQYYAQTGNVEAMKMVLTRTRIGDIDFLRPFNAILELVTKGHSEHLDQILEALQPPIRESVNAAYCAFKLIAKGYDDAAWKVYPANKEFNFDLFPTIKTLFLNEVAPERIISILEKFESMGISMRNLDSLPGHLPFLSSPEYASNMLQTLTSQGLVLKPAYFWPIVFAATKHKDVDVIYKVLPTIVSISEYPKDLDVLYKRVLNPLRRIGQPTETILEKLQESGCSADNVQLMKLYMALAAGEFDRALDLISEGNMTVDSHHLQTFILFGYEKSGQDYQKVAKILDCAPDRNKGLSQRLYKLITAGQPGDVEDIDSCWAEQNLLKSGSRPRSSPTRALWVNSSSLLRQLGFAPTTDATTPRQAGRARKQAAGDQEALNMANKGNLDSLLALEQKQPDSPDLPVALSIAYRQSGRVDELYARVINSSWKFPLGRRNIATLSDRYPDFLQKAEEVAHQLIADRSDEFGLVSDLLVFYLDSPAYQAEAEKLAQKCLIDDQLDLLRVYALKQAGQELRKEEFLEKGVENAVSKRIKKEFYTILIQLYSNKDYTAKVLNCLERFESDGFQFGYLPYPCMQTMKACFERASEPFPRLAEMEKHMSRKEKEFARHQKQPPSSSSSSSSQSDSSSDEEAEQQRGSTSSR